jgi:hypothetical protein
VKGGGEFRALQFVGTAIRYLYHDGEAYFLARDLTRLTGAKSSSPTSVLFKKIKPRTRTIKVTGTSGPGWLFVDAFGAIIYLARSDRLDIEMVSQFADALSLVDPHKGGDADLFRPCDSEPAAHAL